MPIVTAGAYAATLQVEQAYRGKEVEHLSNIAEKHAEIINRHEVMLNGLTQSTQMLTEDLSDNNSELRSLNSKLTELLIQLRIQGNQHGRDARQQP